jgi:O-antigen ligase
MRPARQPADIVRAFLAVAGIAVLVAELLAICFLRYESAAAKQPLSMGAAAVCVAALIQIAAAGPRGWRAWLTTSTLWSCVPFVAYAAAVTASGWGAPAGQYPDVAVEAWWFAGLAIATTQIAGHVRGRRFTLAILIASLAVLMPGVLGPKSAFDLSGRFLRYSSLLQWGAYPEIGMLAMLGAAAALAILATARTWALRMAAGVLAVMFGVALFAVNSRGAVAALIVTAGWLVTVMVLRGRRRLAWLLVGIACAAVLAGVVVYRVQIARIAQSNGEARATAAVSSRSEDWRVAVSMIAAHPLLGVGPGRFPLEYARYSSAPPQNHAHNMLLHVGAESGLLALIPFAVIWGRLLWLTLLASGGASAGEVTAGATEARRDAFVMHAMIAAFFIRAMTDQFLSNVHSSFRTTLLMAIVLGMAEAAAAWRANRGGVTP